MNHKELWKAVDVLRNDIQVNVPMKGLIGTSSSSDIKIKISSDQLAESSIAEENIHFALS